MACTDGKPLVFEDTEKSFAELYWFVFFLFNTYMNSFLCMSKKISDALL